MDKYEYRIKADEIKELIARKEYAEAAEIADTIDWNRVKSVMMLCMISDLYKMNRRYEDAENLLLMADERRPGGKTICYSLCELSIKMGKFVQAYNYYKEFLSIAPQDPGCYVLQYKLYEAQEVSLEERISVLEELKKRDYREKWAYELAYLYHRVGLATRCVEECDEMILWFGDGKYVIKAMELKMLHEPLTEAQQEKYDHRFDGLQAVPEGETENFTGEIKVPETGNDSEEYTDETGAIAVNENPAAQEELDIRVKTMDMSRYNTMNLQAELAAGLREVLSDEQKQSDEVTRSIMAPMLDTDPTEQGEMNREEQADMPVPEGMAEITPMREGDDIAADTDETAEPDGAAAESEMTVEPEADSEPEMTVEPGADSEPEVTAEPAIAADTDETAEPDVAAAESEIAVEPERTVEPEIAAESETTIEPEVAAEPETTVESKADPEPDATAVTVMEEMRRKLDSVEEHAMTAQPPEQMAKVLSQEADGQIRLVMPEKDPVEKQITGQMNIQDILNEWERLKKENEERRKEEVRRHVLQHTGDMFTEFEASVRDGLLEQIESGRVKLDTLDQTTKDLLNSGDTEELQEEIWVTDAEAEPVEAEEAAKEAEAEPVKAEEAAKGAEAEPVKAEEAAKEAEAEPVEAEEATKDAEVESIEGEETTAEPVVTEEIPVEEAQESDYGEVEELEEIEEIEEIEKTEEAEEDKTSDRAEMEAGRTAVRAVSRSEQERSRVRALSKEEEELFEPFIQSRSGRERLVKAVDNISLAAYTGNIIITGDEGMDTLTLAQNMIRDVQLTDSNFSGKVAKISGKGLNTKNVGEILEKLKSGALIIMKASDMQDATIESLHKALQQENFGIVIVLEGTRKAMEKLLKAHPKLGESFTARLNVEAMSNDSLVAYGRKYAREQEYAIDDFGVLALHTRIEELQTIDHAVTTMEVKEIIDEAIRHANRKNLKHFLDILVAKRYDEEDMIILTEKDFV